jgi:hypothetical protein
MVATLKRKKSKPARTPKFVDEKYTGPEPEWLYADDMSAEEYYRERCRTTFYYNYYFTQKDGKPWVIDWMRQNGYTKEQVSAVKNISDVLIPMTVCSYTRALVKGMPVNHSGMTAYLETLPGVSNNTMRDADMYVKEKLEDLIRRGLEVKEAKIEEAKIKDVQRPNIQQLLKEKSMDMANDIDDFVDQFDYKKSTLNNFDPFKILKKVDAKGNHAKCIQGMYEGAYSEIDMLLNPPKRMTDTKKDDYEQIKEGYNHLKKDQIKNMWIMYRNILDACDMIIQESKINRAPRKNKPQSKEKIVSKVKYCKQDTSTNSVSQKPLECLDAQAIMTYNTKTRKLGIYYPADKNSLSFKGTTLINFDENKSVQKTMRKPAEQISMFKKVAKRSLQKEFSAVKSVETKMNGRFNEQTLILRIF